MPIDSVFSEPLAKRLLEIGAVVLRPDDPFMWASGRKAPVYTDNRLTLSYPELRNQISLGFEEIVKEKDLTLDVIVGTATAGIPHAAWLASRLHLPMAYVRSSKKAHGKGNRIEGIVQEGQRVVLVEDLISTGGSALDAVVALREAGAEVECVLAVFSYNLPEADRAFEAAGVSYDTLTDLEALTRVATEEGLLKKEALKALEAWRENPDAWWR